MKTMHQKDKESANKYVDSPSQGLSAPVDNTVEAQART